MRRYVGLVLLLSALLASCGGGSINQTLPTTTEESDLSPIVTTTIQTETSVETTTTLGDKGTVTIPTTTMDLSWEGPVYPLTGLPAYEGIPEAPAVAVKIGNNDQDSLPQHGLREADMFMTFGLRMEKADSWLFTIVACLKSLCLYAQRDLVT